MRNILVTTPNNNRKERAYVIKLLIEYYLGLRLDLKFENDVLCTEIRFHDKKIIIEDHFFNMHIDELSYVNANNIPVSFSVLTNSALTKHPLLIIYGRDYLEIGEKLIHCGIDIFAAAFFYLTRWEEFVLSKDSSELRCNEEKLFAVRNKIEMRPVVNEYLDLLKLFFLYLNIDLKHQKKFQIFQTHDVDWLYLSTFSVLISNIQQLIVKQKLYRKSALILIRYLYYKVMNINPFDSFDDLMNFSDELGLKNTFNFKMCDRTEFGATYAYDDARVRMAINNILQRNHLVGFHPSESCADDIIQFKRELYRLLKLAPDVRGGRQHLLLYQQNTMNIWDNNSLHYDSGFGYQGRNGFRCGICYEFPYFDVLLRKQLDLIEVPFVLMDTVFIRKKSNSNEIVAESKYIIDIVKRYNGVLCTVWHSNLFKTIERKQFMSSYYEIIKYAARSMC